MKNNYKENNMGCVALPMRNVSAFRLSSETLMHHIIHKKMRLGGAGFAFADIRKTR